MPIDRDFTELDKRTLRLGRELFAKVREEQDKESARQWGFISKRNAERMQAPDVVDWADTSSD